MKRAIPKGSGGHNRSWTEEEFRVLFWTGVYQTSTCWLWAGSKRNIYGGVRWPGGKQIGAHVAAYLLERGPIPEGKWVLHTCDVPLCVRPDHLWLGTHAENMADMAAKGRGRGQDKTHCPKGHPYSGKNRGVRASGGRYCCACALEWKRARRAKRRALGLRVT